MIFGLLFFVFETGVSLWWRFLAVMISWVGLWLFFYAAMILMGQQRPLWLQHRAEATDRT